jgi:hypothetical protein
MSRCGWLRSTSPTSWNDQLRKGNKSISCIGRNSNSKTLKWLLLEACLFCWLGLQIGWQSKPAFEPCFCLLPVYLPPPPVVNDGLDSVQLAVVPCCLEYLLQQEVELHHCRFDLD